MALQDTKPAPSVVIADDEPAILEALAEFLTDRGFAVRTCADGTSAVSEITTRVPDLVVLDVSMPGMSGLEIVHRLRFLHGLPSLPVLVITGRDDLATRRQSFHDGADAYITKPFDLATFGAHVDELMNRRRGAWLDHEDRYATLSEPPRTAMPVDPRRAVTALLGTYRSVLGLMARSVDERGPHGRYHSIQVAELASMIAAALRLDPSRRAAIRIAGLFHDLGLALLPDAVYRKPGPLTDAERARVAEHPVLAAHMIGVQPYAGVTKRAVLHHHERWDGAGYPDGLREREIPLGARIVAVADAFAAMTTRTLYGEALPVAEAAAELRRAAGTQFDPEVVESFCAAAGLDS